jgi:cellulose biosynthesis protein BcsQ
MMNTQILYVGGSKGGVGKSTLAFALLEYLMERGTKILLLETDTSNPDVFNLNSRDLITM